MLVPSLALAAIAALPQPARADCPPPDAELRLHPWSVRLGEDRYPLRNARQVDSFHQALAACVDDDGWGQWAALREAQAAHRTRMAYTPPLTLVMWPVGLVYGAIQFERWDSQRINGEEALAASLLVVDADHPGSALPLAEEDVEALRTRTRRADRALAVGWSFTVALVAGTTIVLAATNPQVPILF